MAAIGIDIIDATDKIVTPGLISWHAYLDGSPHDNSFIEDVGPRNFYTSVLFEMLPARAAAHDDAGARVCIDFSIAEEDRDGISQFGKLNLALGRFW